MACDVVSPNSASTLGTFPAYIRKVVVPSMLLLALESTLTCSTDPFKEGVFFRGELLEELPLTSPIPLRWVPEPAILSVF